MTKRKHRGRFIVFEGIDGAGTTTQAQQSVQWLRGRGELAHLTREPTHGPIGAVLRQILGGRLHATRLDGQTEAVSPATIALLFAADRLDHIQNEIEPHLDAGYHVICDRYVVSSLAYQSIETDLRFVRQVNEKAADPDLTIFLRVSADVAMGRIENTRGTRDTFEHLPFQRKVAESYERVFSDYRGGRVVTLDGEETQASVTGKVRAAIESLL